MQQDIKKLKVLLFVLMFMLIVPVLVYSQPTAPDGVDPDTPIDGGISLLLAAGGLLGAKKLREKRNRK